MIAPDEVIRHFMAGEFKITPLGSGHIHKTFSVSGSKNFVLQRVNIQVFKQPEVIARNHRMAFNYLSENHPEFRFPKTLPDRAGQDLYFDAEGFPWRLYEMIENTFTMNEVASVTDAYEAAKGFGALARNLNGIDVAQFQPTLPRFHDLTWRYEQFEEALQKASRERAQTARHEIEQAQSFHFLVTEYQHLIRGGSLRLRVTHNDTKINNILFNSLSRKAVCAIDLDTLMPGYFIYDLGDMVRTFVSPVSEEEKKLDKIMFRKEIYDALLGGYLSEMNSVLTTEEKKSIPFAGKMMTYIMALRFLADYLRGNTYYHITYPEQNLVRASNQLKLLALIHREVA
ncbi:MAG: aminoglycoside phosphotransferase family protein [Bacteroidetes bacterium]|nr:aminoglycoside phosphotransferase family protein [Bacteroidota bacterium]